MPSPSLDGSTFPASGRSITIMLAPHKATEVALPYKPLKPLDIFLQCHEEKNRAEFADKILIQSSLGGPDQKHHFLIPAKSGFLFTVMQAYNEHHNLVIRPDDVWLTILLRFNTYVNQNVEELRYKFVAHEGKKLVKFYTTEGNRFTNNWGTLSQNLTQKMEEFLVDKSLKPWILPNFTTTVETDVAVASAVMLSTFKGYFRYRVIFLCGIPSVTLTGTRADWESVLQRVQQLHRFEIESNTLRQQVVNPHGGGSVDQPGPMENWQRRLEVIVKRLIAAFDGEENEDFWSHVFTETRYGSGGQRSITGWITALATFDPGSWCDSNYQLDGVQFGCLDTDDLPIDLAEVPIEIDDNGYKVMGSLRAGVLGARKLNATTIGFERAWWMFENIEAGWF
jgi:Domain of unknown function (DUF4419)